uniref:Putative secreted protein n=1 Tax=Ixodes ricinus TaxID=34613 RepID=A0A6B0TWA0_IXORI
MRNAGHLLAPSLQQALVAFSHALSARALWRLLPAILVLHLVLQAHPRSVQKHTIVYSTPEHDSGDMLNIVPTSARA